MKYTIKILVLSLFLLAVSKKIEPSDVAKLNGYWEIEK
jgi:hypothetical protein